MNLALIAYHRNAYERYSKVWIDQYRDSILAQSEAIDVFELDYGGGDAHIFDSAKRWWSCPLRNHAEAQNAMLDALFDLGYEGVLNSNVDDFYPTCYAAVSARQLSNGTQLSSGNFTLVNGDGAVIYEHKNLHEVNIGDRLAAQDNVVCHPAVAYRKDFWLGSSRYNPDELPLEDLRLWQREVHRFRFIIAPECLVTHRVHESSVSAQKA